MTLCGFPAGNPICLQHQHHHKNHHEPVHVHAETHDQDVCEGPMSSGGATEGKPFFCAIFSADMLPGIS